MTSALTGSYWKQEGDLWGVNIMLASYPGSLRDKLFRDKTGADSGSVYKNVCNAISRVWVRQRAAAEAETGLHSAQPAQGAQAAVLEEADAVPCVRLLADSQAVRRVLGLCTTAPLAAFMVARAEGSATPAADPQVTCPLDLPHRTPRN